MLFMELRIAFLFYKFIKTLHQKCKLIRYVTLCLKTNLVNNTVIQVSNSSGSDLGGFSKETIWGYLQSYNMADVMIGWIHSSYHGNQNHQDTRWPTCHLGTIPVEFVDQLDCCPSYTKRRVLKAFAV